ncbi:MAG: DUF2299 family protein [Acidobacteria bacterium]|nr:DUF2299 family protein [Acidobacteriota bacterium]
MNQSAKNKAPERARRALRRWLTADSWQVEDRIGENALWAIAARDPNDKTLVFVVPQHHQDVLVIYGYLKVSNQRTARLEKMSKKERENILWSFRSYLLSAGIMFSGFKIPLEVVRLAVPIYLEDLSRTSLMDRARKVLSGLAMISGLLGQSLGEASDPEEGQSFDFDSLEIN